MIVEFFGAPGGGKTHLLRNLVATLPGAIEARAGARREVLQDVARYGLRHPLSFCIWILELCLHANGLFRYKLGLLLRSMAARMIAERADAPTICIDEGVLQRLLTIFDTPLSARHAAFVIWATPKPHVVVVVQGGRFARFTQVDDRLNSPRASAGEEQLRLWMRNVEANAATVSPLLTKLVRGCVQVSSASRVDVAAVHRELARYREVLE